MVFPSSALSSVTGMAVSGGNISGGHQHDREAALLRFAHLRAMFGQPDPQRSQRRREAEEAAWKAKRCFRCDQDLQHRPRLPGGPLDRQHPGPGGHSFVAVPLCQSCSSSSGRSSARAYEARCPVCQRRLRELLGTSKPALLAWLPPGRPPAGPSTATRHARLRSLRHTVRPQAVRRQVLQRRVPPALLPPKVYPRLRDEAGVDPHHVRHRTVG